MFGLAFTFIGFKFQPLLISSFVGFMISRLFPFSSIILALLFIGGFAFLSRFWWLHFQLHSAALFFGVGIYLAQILWFFLASFYAPEWTLHLFDGLMAVFFGFYGYQKTDKRDVVAATTFLGAIIVAYSINLFTEGKIGINGNDGVQAACIVVLGYLGHMVQMKGQKEDNEQKIEEIEGPGIDGSFL
jgi:hypothetical protein